jgi:hypothetical protein
MQLAHTFPHNENCLKNQVILQLRETYFEIEVNVKVEVEVEVEAEVEVEVKKLL